MQLLQRHEEVWRTREAQADLRATTMSVCKSGSLSHKSAVETITKLRYRGIVRVDRMRMDVPVTCPLSFSAWAPPVCGV